MKRPDAITEDDLHAYVDGLLSDDDRAAVESWLAERPEDQSRVQAWKNRPTFCAMPSPPMPPHIRMTPRCSARKEGSHMAAETGPPADGGGPADLRSGRRSRQAAALLLSTPQDVTLASLTTDIPAQAKSAYLIYASEVRHPVEVGAGEQQHLRLGLASGSVIPSPSPICRRSDMTSSAGVSSPSAASRARC